jgi:CBS domain-containing protein
MYTFWPLHAADAMTRNPVTIAPTASLSEVEQVFEQHDFNGLPVIDDRERLIGVITKFDLLKAFLFTEQAIVPHYAEIMQQTVEQVMTCQLVTFEPTTPLTRILQKMVETHNKGFPVVEQGRLVGMIAREDILRTLRRTAEVEISSASYG